MKIQNGGDDGGQIGGENFDGSLQTFDNSANYNCVKKINYRYRMQINLLVCNLFYYNVFLVQKN